MVLTHSGLRGAVALILALVVDGEDKKTRKDVEYVHVDTRSCPLVGCAALLLLYFFHDHPASSAGTEIRVFAILPSYVGLENILILL